MRAAGVVELEVAGEPLLCLEHTVVGVQVDVLVFNALPQPFDEHVIHPSALAVHAELDTMIFEHSPVNASLVNWLPWSVLKISGGPYFAIASSSASTQESGVILVDTRCARTLRVAQSMMATRKTKPRLIGI